MSCESLKWCFSTWDMPGSCKDMPGSCKRQIEHTEVSRRLEEAWAGSEGSRPWRLETASKWPGPPPSGVDIKMSSPGAAWSQNLSADTGGAAKTNLLITEPQNCTRTRTCIHRCSSCRYHGITGTPRPPTLRHMTPSWGRAGRRLRNPEDWTFTLKRLSHPREII